MGTLWPGRESSWVQDDGASSFKLGEIRGQVCAGNTESLVSLAQLLGARRHPSGGACGGAGRYLPPDFNRCPYCSEQLATPPAEASVKWLPPYGVGNGLRLFPAPLRGAAVQPASGAEFVVPPRGGPFVFAVCRMGAEQRLLVAVDRISGTLWVFNRDTAAWAEIAGRVGECSLPAWSWAVACDELESGLCLPTDEGPVWAEINWATGALVIDRAAGVSVGAAVSAGKYLLAPVLRDGAFALVYRSPGGAWVDCVAASDGAAVVAQLCRNPAQEPACGIPVFDDVRNVVYWPLRGGYIKVSGFASGAPTWKFLPWETDEHPAMGLIELGAPVRRTGTQPGFWQLCEDRDTSVRDGIVNRLIKFDGDEHADSEIVECGQFLSTGQACFAWSEDYWTDVQQRNARLEEQTELRFPLVQFGDRGLVLVAKVLPWEGRDESLVFSDFVFNRMSKNRVMLRFVIENEGTPEIPLVAEGVDGGNGSPASLFRATLGNVAEISCFIHENAVFVYLPEDNRCYRWFVSAWGLDA